MDSAQNSTPSLQWDISPGPHKTEATDTASSLSSHPILLAIRYVRQLAKHYSQEFGAGYPDIQKLLAIDPEPEIMAKEVIRRTLKSGELTLQLQNPLFKELLNDAIHGAFRNPTNPTAAYLLYQYFGVLGLVERYAGDIEPINQYLFARRRDQIDVYRQRLSQLGLAEDAVMVRIDQAFPGGYAYHGTKTEDNFWRILRQGILPSEDGDAGSGLYVVAEDELPFAEGIGNGREHIVRFHIKDNARIVDITRGDGKRIFDAFGKSHTEFAEHFGFDILLYPFAEARAFVVKNSDVIDCPEGLTRNITRFSELFQMALRSITDKQLQGLLGLVDRSHLSSEEIGIVLSQVPWLRNLRSLKKIRSSWEKDQMPRSVQNNFLRILVESLIAVHGHRGSQVAFQNSLLRLAGSLKKIRLWQRRVLIQHLTDSTKELFSQARIPVVVAELKNNRPRLFSWPSPLLGLKSRILIWKVSKSLTRTEQHNAESQ